MMEEYVPLAPLTTFQIGGSARYFVRAHAIGELRQALDHAKEHNLPVLVLGGGSNVLVADKGYDGVVLKIELPGITAEGNIVVASAGESWDKLVEFTVARGLWGLENLSGIPGSVGGAVVGSIGAYGAAVAQTVVWVEALECATGEVKKFSNAECRFGYRQSIFSGGDFIVLRAAFVLNSRGAPNVSYKDLAGCAGYSLSQVRQKVLDTRAGKFPDLTVEGTAGSFFKNPIVTPEIAAELAQRYPAMPLFAMPEVAGTKVPLAWLLDHELKLKGTSVGGARLYEKQALVIAAKKNTSAHDVVALAQLVEEKVKEKFNLTIEREVKVIL